ncbi:MAG: peptide methionine sulfoxide reductase [Saprospiraceae bacterium]|nr:peptide methionine sulfoxide reductase [Lewinella sp.]
MDLAQLIHSIPVGYSEVLYNGKKYSLTRQDLAGGRSIKVFARELGGTDFISFNYYHTGHQDHLKPCEMPEQKVIDFLRDFQLLETY